MTAIEFLAEWALRSSILILGGALLLWVVRVKDPSIRLAAWTGMLCGSLAIPALMTMAPSVPLGVMRTPAPRAEAPSALHDAAPGPAPAVSYVEDRTARTAAIIYIFGVLLLLLRLIAGFVMSMRLLRESLATGEATDAIEIRESDRVAAPVTLGIVRPAIVLPAGWREWDGAKLEAVLAHERSHIKRYDPAVQLLSAIHRSLLWFGPLSWFLHKRIVRAAEEASDDAAVTVIRDRALYAELLLDFMRHGVRGASWLGVPMSRYDRADKRIQRILDGTTLSRGVTRWGVAAILTVGSPLAWMVAAAHPQNAPKETAPQVKAVGRPESAPVYLDGLGSVAATTVTVKPKVDGELLSVSFKEGDMVKAGQVVASIDPRPYQLQLKQAEGRDQAGIDQAKLLLSYTQIRAPITGMAGLRLVDPGNIVHATDATGILTITQLHPIAVLFKIPEDTLPRVRALLREGARLPVEAWNRGGTVKIATGRLTALDNQIDAASGDVKLKAVFDNQDDALFPNQFVNVRLLLESR